MAADLWPVATVTRTGMEIEFVDERGSRRRVPIEDADPEVLLVAAPVRKAANYSGRTNRIGYVWIATGPRSVPFESLLEEEAILWLDSRPDVAAIATQAFRFHRSDKPRAQNHVPDVFYRKVDGSYGVVAVKPISRQHRDRERRGFAFAAEAAAIRGRDFEIAGELDEGLSRSVQLLRAYRRPLPVNDPLVEAVLGASQRLGPTRLVDLVSEVGEWPCVLPVAGHLLWHGRLTMDWESGLSEDSIVAPTRVPV